MPDFINDTWISPPSVFLIGFLLLILWLWILLDCARRDFRNSIEKAIWILALILTPGIAIIAYLLVIKYSNPQGIMKK